MEKDLSLDSCWEAMQARDRSAEGRFICGVLTTGIYCRPGCPARLPLRKNVRFYRNTMEARGDGLRACLRCKPDESSSASIDEICRYLRETAAQPVSLTALAKRAGLSPAHFQRTFKAATGVSPRQYQEAHRLDKLKTTLRSAADVTGAVYDAGFDSSRSVYERAGTHLGMTPGQYRRGGENVMITYASTQTPFGVLMIGATDKGLCSVQLGEDVAPLLDSLRKEFPAAEMTAMRQPYSPDFQNWMTALLRHLEGQQPSLALPLDIRGTAFQIQVWEYLRSIPYGQVQSYGEVAAAIGAPSATRAVANACAANRLAIAIPCHRVIRQGGELGGYRWGEATKRALIDRERSGATVAC